MRGHSFVAGALMIVALATACSGSTYPVPAAPGKVTGLVEQCSGLPQDMLPSPPPMIVYAQARGLTVAQKTFPGTEGSYSFSLPPGSYTIAAPKSEDPAQKVTVVSRETLTVNFPNRCK